MLTRFNVPLYFQKQKWIYQLVVGDMGWHGKLAGKGCRNLREELVRNQRIGDCNGHQWSWWDHLHNLPSFICPRNPDTDCFRVFDDLLPVGRAHLKSSTSHLEGKWWNIFFNVYKSYISKTFHHLNPIFPIFCSSPRSFRQKWSEVDRKQTEAHFSLAWWKKNWGFEERIFTISSWVHVSLLDFRL